MAKKTVKKAKEEKVVSNVVGRKEILSEVAEALEMSAKDAKEVVEAVLNSIKENILRGNSVGLKGLGTFKVTDKPAGKARNPRTGETVDVLAKHVVKFKIAATLKAAVAII